MKPFTIENNVLKSGSCTVYVMGAKEERETMLQLMQMALNAYYSPEEAARLALEAIKDLPENDPQRKRLEALQAQAESRK